MEPPALFPVLFPDPMPERPLPETPASDDPGRRTVLCRVCGRPLTGAHSRRTGLGPDCDAKLRHAGPHIPVRRHEADQDPLPGI